MAAFCWVPFFITNRGQAFFGGFGFITSVFFLAFMAMVISAFRNARGPIELDAQGVSASGRRLLWSEVTEATEERLPEKMVVLKNTQGKPLSLSIASYQDGAEMGRIVQSLVDRPGIDVEEVKTYVRTDRKTVLFGYGTMLLLTVFLAVFTLQTPMPSGAKIHPGLIQLVIIVPGLIWLIARSATGFVQIGPRKLSVGNVFGRRSIEFSVIDSIEQKDRGVELRAGGRTIVIGQVYTNYAELRQRLFSLVPKGAEKAEVPVSLQATEQFCPKRGAWAGPGVAGIFGGGLGVAGIVGGVIQIQSGNLNGGVFLMLMCAVPGGLGVAGLYAAAVSSNTSYAVDADGLEQRSPLRTIRIHWTDVESAWRTGAMLKNYRLKTPGRELEVNGEFLEDAPRLMDYLDAQFKGLEAKASKQIQGETFGPSPGAVGTGLFLGVMGVLVTIAGATCSQWMRARPGEESARTLMSVLWFITGLGMLFLAVMVNLRRYTPTPEGLVARSIKGTRFLRWSEITRAETTLLTGKSPRKMLVLEHPEGAVKIDGQLTREFSRLKAIILAHVDPSVVREDSRGN